MSEKDRIHELIVNYREVAQDLGRSPSRDEYLSHPARKFSKNQILEYFGSWMQLMRAAGSTPSPQARDSKRDPYKLREQYYEHLKREIERLRTDPLVHAPAKRLLAIGDCHAPFMHQDYPRFLIALHEKYDFDRVVCVGDEVDHHALSFHDSDPDLPSAGPELRAAIAMLKPLYEAFPVMDIAESNHGSMVYRKGKHHGVPRQVLKSYHEQLECPSTWRWHFEIKVELSNGRTCLVHHSYGANAVAQSQKRAMSVIFGHDHTKQGVAHWGNVDQEYFAMHVGCGIDDRSLAFAYNKNTVERPRLGAGLVIEGEPIVAAMRLDNSGRWNGRLP